MRDLERRRICGVLRRARPAGLPIPENWNFAEAATLPENLFTVFDNLVTRAGLKAGEAVLIHGGTSGIGSMAIMVSREVGAIPFATAGSDDKGSACVGFGARERHQLPAIGFRRGDQAAYEQPGS